MELEAKQTGTLFLTSPGGQVQEFALSADDVTLGRSEVNDIVLQDASVSRIHARIDTGPGHCTIVDLGSANGVRVNGRNVERAALEEGDSATIGPFSLRVEFRHEEPEPDVTVMQTLADLESTLAGASLPVNLSETSEPTLTVHTPARTWEVPLETDAVSIGRSATGDIVLDDQKASREHAVVERRGDVFTVRDLGSRNGTWISKKRVETQQLRNSDTIRIGDALIVFKSGFEAEDMTLVDTVLPVRRERRPVVIVPGMMGSELWQGSHRVWPNVKHMFTHPDTYMLPEKEPLQARGLVGEVVIVPNLYKMDQYGRLCQYMEEALGYQEGRDLLTFSYDWRKDIREASRKLAQTVDEWNVTGPVTIIAHSMGSLVSRYYVERLGGKSKVERLLMMGAPHNGGPKAISALVTGKGLIPFGLMGEQVRRVFSTFTSAHQVLPTYACVFDQDGKPVDLLKDEGWVPEPQRAELRTAREFRRELRPRSSVPCVSIFGYGLKTTTRVDVRRDADGAWKNARFTEEPSGDASVPESSAILPGSDIHPVRQYHGSLYVDNDVKMRLKLELTSD
jgi:pSer/pThr/pTyr-binding forkhead associated (FHA) protein/pimeloyl-ACP methyl ester carboxylesterase